MLLFSRLKKPPTRVKKHNSVTNDISGFAGCMPLKSESPRDVAFKRLVYAPGHLPMESSGSFDTSAMESERHVDTSAMESERPGDTSATESEYPGFVVDAQNAKEYLGVELDPRRLDNQLVRTPQGNLLCVKGKLYDIMDPEFIKLRTEKTIKGFRKMNKIFDDLQIKPGTLYKRYCEIKGRPYIEDFYDLLEEGVDCERTRKPTIEDTYEYYREREKFSDDLESSDELEPNI